MASRRFFGYQTRTSEATNAPSLCVYVAVKSLHRNEHLKPERERGSPPTRDRRTCESGPGPASHQYHSYALDRCGAEGKFGASRRANGAGAGGLFALAKLFAV